MLFKRAKYKVYLIDEYNTSKMCYLNGLEMERFKYVPNPRPWKSNTVIRHGLLRLKNVPKNNSLKNLLLNRDLNGSMNILEKAKCRINKKEIPKYLSRK